VPVNARDLAETIMSIIEGGFILSRSYNDPAIIARLTRQFRTYFELLFQPKSAKTKAVAGKRRA
jgi:TetR/AcrR family transcriptional repressor of nem operon